ncbi:hypothetical protein B0H14DRAFT_3508720 [Mycena olivaceomarginata]|nr:hypothetical protein B0H14DRAFT_3508720 [Mycena olivaceomarginata]
MSRSTIHDLLDPTPPLSGHAAQSVDVSTTLRSLLGAFSQHCPVDRPIYSPPGPRLKLLLSRPPPPLQPPDHATRSAEYNPGVPVEYPESGLGAPVGHLIPMTPGTRLPWVDFAYSRGAPDGGSAKEDVFFTDLLVDQNGVPVPCKKRHSTCGSTFAFTWNFRLSGSQAKGLKASTRQDVQGRLAAVREARQRLSSPQRDIFLHTSAYISAVCQLGCRRPLQQDTGRTGQELQDYEREQQLAEHFRRGYSAPSRCAGRIVYHEYPDPTDKNGSRAYLSCEHYSRQTPDHWSDFSIQDGAYDVNYIAAHFSNDSEELARIKGAAAAEDIGPLASCRTLRNHTVQNAALSCVLPQIPPLTLTTNISAIDHRVDGRLAQVELCHIDCDVNSASGSQQIFKTTPTATLTTLHPSLANRAHLAAYIAQVREEHFPHGTDWKGILHLKRVQDQQLPAHQHYIRVVLDLDNAALTPHDEDDEPAPPGEQRTRMVICMSPDCSARLKNAQYLQSDISFKRVIEYDEFEITGMDRDANTSVVFCRVLCTTTPGRALHWRHLHGRDPNDFSVGLILHWGADQHRGQAKGLGLHLVERAAELPADRMDMHEPERSLRSLGPYDHLRRVYRVCKVHNYRNIQQCAVPEHVRQLMRSLTCIRHADWQGAIDQILRDGGKAAKDGSTTKRAVASPFPASAGSAALFLSPYGRLGSRIPTSSKLCIGMPTVTGSTATLVGGLLRGQDYDEMQRATLAEYEAHGIRPSYDAVTPVTNALKNVIRCSNRRTKKLQTTALAVSSHNSNIHRCHQKLAQALADFDNLRRVLTAPHLQSSSAQAVLKQEITSATLHARKAANAYDRQLKVDSPAGLVGFTIHIHNIFHHPNFFGRTSRPDCLRTPDAIATGTNFGNVRRAASHLAASFLLNMDGLFHVHLLSLRTFTHLLASNTGIWVSFTFSTSRVATLWRDSVAPVRHPPPLQPAKWPAFCIRILGF